MRCMLTIVSLGVLVLATVVHGENSTKNVFGEEEREFYIDYVM